MRWLSFVLVGGCAICWDVGIVLQKRAADTLPPLVPGKGLAGTLWRFVRSPAWLGGAIASAAGWVLFTAALTFTPVSLARSIQGIGFVILAAMSVLFLSHRLKPLEWVGVLAVSGGVVLLGVSEPPGPPATPVVVPMHLAFGLAAVLAACGLLELLRRAPGLRLSGVVASAAVAGTLLGTGDVLTRAVIVEAARSPAVAFGVLGPVLVASYLVGFVLLSRGYQHGRAIVVTGVSDLAARLVTLALGILAMDEALPADPVLRAERVAGFLAVLAGTSLLARVSAEGLTKRESAATS